MKPALEVPVGTTATRTIVVGKEMTVAAHVEDMPEVYGTPIMIYHMESVAGEAMMPFMPEGWVTVGVAVDVKHLAATPTGARVTVRAEVISVSNHTVTFAIVAHDEFEKVGEGTHVRAPVEMERFMKKVREKARQLG